MGIFTRFRDIVNSNINAMLDAAEDPEKMIRLMIQEMEETLIEMKSACAGTLATQARVERQISQVKDRVEKWEANAKLALTRNREDLAREALHEKRRHRAEFEALEAELESSNELVEDHQRQITQLEKKLAQAREKQRLLVQRHTQAHQKYQAQSHIRRVDHGDATVRFDQFENRIERMEAAAGMVAAPSDLSLEDQFQSLERDDEIEKDLQRLKEETQPQQH